MAPICYRALLTTASQYNPHGTAPAASRLWPIVRTLRGHALSWHTELDDATLSSLSHDLDAWYAGSARAEARQLRFDFNRSELKLSDYLYLKVSHLRAAGTLDSQTIKSELWEGLDSKLALIVRPYDFEIVDDFRRRIREAEPSARHLPNQFMISRPTLLNSHDSSRLPIGHNGLIADTREDELLVKSESHNPLTRRSFQLTLALVDVLCVYLVCLLH